ncbi:hypothetical protein NUU61_004441 [Penicillium alfredii]|uniref:Uncharacterized protein n=1 Tax=Penicillium alfredii TaxID=1506179 RepID=A0A9W9FL35_9EURO|nr:uncharacterized protein NUU61_004441 [Penicillium alfredii]KAJ5102219.1 hypothetical protein NUU61_004441 [Penicillium alfredii]
MQTAAIACEHIPSIEPKEFLTQLLLDNLKRLNAIDIKFYIVLNKIGDSEDNVYNGVFNFLKNASSAGKGSVRVLFTATEGTTKKLKQRGLKCSTMSMNRNIKDIRKYIDTRMDKMDVFSDTEDDQVQDLRKTIQTRLYAQTGGNYYMMDKTLSEINPAAAFFLVGYRLGTIYLGKAKWAKEGKQEDEAKRWLHRLSEVVPEQVPENQMRLPLSPFAARYYHNYGNLQAARSAAHNTLRMAMELLSDGDSTNDILAYKKILYAVILFEDEINAATALAMMKVEAPDGVLSMDCSCHCGHRWKEAVKDRRIVNHVCHESHGYFYIPKWNEQKTSQVPETLVPWNGEIVKMERWRKEITKAYHLTKFS